MAWLDRIFKRRAPTEKDGLALVREQMSALGYDLSDISDEAIKDGMRQFAVIAKNCGMTTSEAEEAFRAIRVNSGGLPSVKNLKMNLGADNEHA